MNDSLLNNIRNLWEEDMEYTKEDLNDKELDSLNHCSKSNYKYFIRFGIKSKHVG